MNILLDSFFEASASGHGGNHRSAQILELIERSQNAVTRLDRQLLISARDRYLAGMQSLLNPSTTSFIFNHQIEVKPALKNLAFCGFQRQLYDQALAQHSGAKVLIWEATKNYVAPYVAKDQGFHVIAIPHNLEFFVADAFHESLSTELQALAKADIVFCTSREEEWLLRLHQANAHYLPYYPSKEIADRMLKIRHDRAQTSRSRYLILGSASNPPTKVGMIEQIQWLKQIRQQFSFEVDIAGYETESLKSYCDETFTVHGSVSEAKLTVLLTEAKAALVHQTASSGVLTRIPELLIAGIPVIANGNACRSAFGYSGVYCYDDLFELLDLMKAAIAVPPLFPHPIAAENRFISYLKAL